ncbi:MAG TPA: prenyltransferase/squalene oxidase repeat-containing protein, partial [Verrucomicrobiae bacterium]|nr:prenyltransferase/squalene oxidase repeat-containing protein [Verrucomicrobiae bacterium]
MNTIIPVVLLSLIAFTATAAELPSKERSILNEVERTQKRGLDWLLKQQKPDGSWDNHPAISALAATAFLRSGQKLNDDQQQAVDRAMKFILSNVKTNGAIYRGDETDKYPNYSTAISIMALSATRNPQYLETIRHARDFLLNSQFDESGDIVVTNASYGGIGYGERQRPDLSNTAWTLEALRVAENYMKQLDQPAPSGWDLHWQKAIVFLQRCQNLPSHND